MTNLVVSVPELPCAITYFEKLVQRELHRKRFEADVYVTIAPGPICAATAGGSLSPETIAELKSEATTITHKLFRREKDRAAALAMETEAKSTKHGRKNKITEPHLERDQPFEEPT